MSSLVDMKDLMSVFEFRFFVLNNVCGSNDLKTHCESTECLTQGLKVHLTPFFFFG